MWKRIQKTENKWASGVKTVARATFTFEISFIYHYLILIFTLFHSGFMQDLVCLNTLWFHNWSKLPYPVRNFIVNKSF